MNRTLLLLAKNLLAPTLAVLVLQNAAVAEDAPPPMEGAEPSPLHELAWIVGDWQDEEGLGRVSVSCQWTKNQQFITRQFSVLDEQGEPLLEGTQVVGWDPAESRIRSWTFDSEGGFGEGFWERDGDCWRIKATFTLSTGEHASALNLLTQIDQDTATWRSINREVGGAIQPNQPEIRVVRVQESSSDSTPTDEGDEP